MEPISSKRGYAAIPPTSNATRARDLFVTIIGIYPLVAISVASLVWRRLTTATDLSLGQDLQRSLLRNLGYIPESVKRWLLLSDTRAILESPRFRELRPRLEIKVSEPEFEGYWLYKAPPAEASGKNVTLFWIHGGGYTIGDPFMGFVLLLRVVELAARQGVSLSLFSLDYTLAPQAQFPRQQQEALSAYRYLVEDQGTDAGNIVIGGESAGGHVALTALLAINDARLPKPGGALLLYPWVNLKNAGESFVRNKNLDMLSKPSLDHSVQLVLGRDGQKKHDDLVDFSAPLSNGRSWARLLPAQTRVNVGSHDLFVDDVGLFVRNAKADGADIVLEVTPKKGHGWQMVDNMPKEKGYYSMDPAQEVERGVLPGSDSVADHIFELFKAMDAL